LESIELSASITVDSFTTRIVIEDTTAAKDIWLTLQATIINHAQGKRTLKSYELIFFVYLKSVANNCNKYWPHVMHTHCRILGKK